MIFTNKEWENGSPLQFIGVYHPYKRRGKKNPKFDWFSGYILDVKESKGTALVFFAKRIEPLVAKDVVICYVPSHDAAKKQTGIRTLAQRLALAGRVDGTGCLVREHSVDKAALGGKRGVDVHFDSIAMNNPEVVKDREVLLLDDVTTTNASLIACRQILMKAGARSVKCLALGQTASDD